MPFRAWRWFLGFQRFRRPLWVGFDRLGKAWGSCSSFHLSFWWIGSKLRQISGAYSTFLWRLCLVVSFCLARADRWCSNSSPPGLGDAFEPLQSWLAWCCLLLLPTHSGASLCYRASFLRACLSSQAPRTTLKSLIVGSVDWVLWLSWSFQDSPDSLLVAQLQQHLQQLSSRALHISFAFHLDISWDSQVPWRWPPPASSKPPAFWWVIHFLL